MLKSYQLRNVLVSFARAQKSVEAAFIYVSNPKGYPWLGFLLEKGESPEQKFPHGVFINGQIDGKTLTPRLSYFRPPKNFKYEFYFLLPHPNVPIVKQ